MLNSFKVHKKMCDRFGFDKNKLTAHNLKNKKLDPLFKGFFFIILGILSYDVGRSLLPGTHCILKRLFLNINNIILQCGVEKRVISKYIIL